MNSHQSPPDRPVRYELHIAPLFRRIDRDHMAFAFDISDPATFYEADGQPKIDLIRGLYDHMTGATTPLMPPVHAGGPWPREWLDLFARWINEGCLRLELGTAQYRASRTSATQVRLAARVELPSSDHETWFERVDSSEAPYAYCLVVEPPVSDVPPATSDLRFLVEELNDFPSGLSSILVADAGGSHVVDIAEDAPESRAVESWFA